MISLVRGVRGFNWTSFPGSGSTVTLINGGDPSTMIADHGRTWPSPRHLSPLVCRQRDSKNFKPAELSHAQSPPFLADFYRPPLSAH